VEVELLVQERYVKIIVFTVPWVDHLSAYILIPCNCHTYIMVEYADYIQVHIHNLCFPEDVARVGLQLMKVGFPVILETMGIFNGGCS